MKKVDPNEVLFISDHEVGRRDESGVNIRSWIITGCRAFTLFVHGRNNDLSLEIMTIDISTPDMPTSEGLPVSIVGVAQLKIGSVQSSIRQRLSNFIHTLSRKSNLKPSRHRPVA